MTRFALLIVGAFATVPFAYGQQAAPSSADAGISPVAAPASRSYEPPTHGEKFRTYVRHTYGIGSILEAGARAGIDQGLHRPSEWQEGAKGYAERFGSAMGLHAARGTTAYVFGELFREDLRYVHCTPNCSASNRFKAAFENTFTAAKGSDGHREFSFARLIGPISGSLVASTWRPRGFGRGEAMREIGFTYGLGLMRNLVRKLVRRQSLSA